MMILGILGHVLWLKTLKLNMHFIFEKAFLAFYMRIYIHSLMEDNLFPFSHHHQERKYKVMLCVEADYNAYLSFGQL